VLTHLPRLLKEERKFKKTFAKVLKKERIQIEIKVKLKKRQK
jgi:hypothetical protein